MSVHMGFTLLALGALLATSPLIIVAWLRRQAYRRLAIGLYVGGFTCIFATLLLDPILRPPLFYHGFFPGIGASCVAVALALVLRHWQQSSYIHQRSQPFR